MEASAAGDATTAPPRHTFANGDSFIGQLKNGVPHGRGTYKNAVNGDVVEGDFVLGRLHGEGSITRKNGDVLAGAFVRDKLETGSYVYRQRSANNGNNGGALQYRGTFKDNVPHGVGTLEFANGDVYTGAFQSGRAHGTGKYALANGDLVAGLFERGRLVRGTREFARTGHKFSGEFQTQGSALPQFGLGQMEFANGDVYNGQFANGRFQGRGTYFFAQHALALSCANWDRDAPTGVVECTLRSKEGDAAHFLGSFFGDGRRHHLVDGKGVLKFGDGTWLESASFVRRLGELPSDYEGGAYYFDKRNETRAWVSLQADGLNSSKRARGGEDVVVWLGMPPDLGGLRFSSTNPPPQQEEKARMAALLLASHQRLQFELARAAAACTQFVWVQPADFEAAAEEDFCLAMAKGVALGEASRALCLLPKPKHEFGKIILAQLMPKLRALVPNAMGAHVVLGKEQQQHCVWVVEGDRGSELASMQALLAKLQRGCDLLVLCLTTNSTSSSNNDDHHFFKDLHCKRLVVIWLGDCSDSIALASATCARIGVELCSL